MALFFEMVPDADDFLLLPPEEVAGLVLQIIHSLPEDERRLINRENFVQEDKVIEYPCDRYEELLSVVMEGWAWLESEGFLVPQVSTFQAGAWFVLSRKGNDHADAAGFESYRKAALLPKHLLHPVIVQRVWHLYIRGDHDTAVFQAFKQVEVAVREAGGFDATDLGHNLMRKAFATGSGPLSDAGLPDAEQEAIAHLFAGAISAYKNPGSHRNIDFNDPTVAAELIILASHLIRTVERATVARSWYDD